MGTANVYIHLIEHCTLNLGHRSFASAVTLVEEVDELALLPDEDVEIDREELTLYETLQSVGDHRFIDRDPVGEHRLQEERVSSESIVTDAHRI